MDCWLCPSCAQQAPWAVIAVEEISNRSFAPWTSGEVDSLREYQQSEVYLPFVCDQHHVLRPTKFGMKCNYCPKFILAWAYPWALDWSWKDE